jgi:hypothetical protein
MSSLPSVIHISSVLLVVRPITKACPKCWLTYNSIAFSSPFSNYLWSLFPLNLPLCTQLWKGRYWIPLSRHIVHNHFLFQDTPSIIGHTMCCFMLDGGLHSGCNVVLMGVKIERKSFDPSSVFCGSKGMSMQVSMQAIKCDLIYSST